MNDNTIMTVAAHTEELANSLLSQGKNVLLCNENNSTVFDIATMKKIHIDDLNAAEFFSDFDVVEYVPSEGLYKRFNSKSNDNALITSEKCNSCCIMCPYSDHFRANAKNVSVQRILKIIDYISMYPSHLTITGGEPTLIGPEMFDIMDSLKRKFPDTEYLFLTNGRIFSCNDYFDKFVSHMPGDICFAIPIYGDTPETHDSITRSSGSFTEAVKGMQNFMRAGTKVEIRIVVSKLNYNNLENIAKFITNYLSSAYVVNFVGLEMCGNAARNRNDVWIDYPIAFNSMKNAIDILCSESINVGIYNFPLCSVNESYRPLCRRSISDYKIVYDQLCSECTLRPICGGIFKSTYILEHPEVNPVKGYA